MQFLNRTISCQLKTKKAAPIKERLVVASAGITYLQLAQVQASPQLQLTQVQFALLHFSF